MKDRETFIEFIASMISNEHFINRSEEDKKEMYMKLQELFEGRVESAWQAGHHAGWMEGMRAKRMIAES